MGNQFFQGRQHIWNHYDELGLLIGISRYEGETNYALRSRLLGRYSDTQNSTYQGLTNAISADLGYAVYNVIDKKIYILTNKPELDYQVIVSVDGVTVDQVVESWPLPSGWSLLPGVNLIADPSGFTDAIPQTYEESASGWILWRDDKGDYTQILEFLSPPTEDSEVAVEYYYEVDGYLRYYKEQTFTERQDRDLYGKYGRFTGRSRETSTGISVNALSDSDYRTDVSNGLMTAEGTATELLASIAKVINDAAPVLWDHFRWDEGRWDAGDKEETGSEALPSILDAGISGFLIVGDS